MKGWLWKFTVDHIHRSILSIFKFWSFLLRTWWTCSPNFGDQFTPARRARHDVWQQDMSDHRLHDSMNDTAWHINMSLHTTYNILVTRAFCSNCDRQIMSFGTTVHRRVSCCLTLNILSGWYGNSLTLRRMALRQRRRCFTRSAVPGRSYWRSCRPTFLVGNFGVTNPA